MARQKGKTFNTQDWFKLLDKYAAEESFVLHREQAVAAERAAFENNRTEGSRDP
jgi:hypothetical protein